MLTGGSGWGTVFCCYLRPLQDSLVMKSGCSGNDGAGKLFWGINKLSSCCFLVAIKFFSHFIGKCQCNRDEIEGRYLKLIDAIDQSGGA